MSSQAETTLNPAAIGVGACARSPRDGVQGRQGIGSLTRRGGAYLTARYGVSILVSLGNMFVLTWWIGPHAYGLFVTAISLTGFLASLTRLGIDTYLVRCEPAPDRNQYNLAFTLILANSIALVAVGATLVPLLKHWYGKDEFVAPYLALLLCVPLTGLAGPATAKLERELNFRAVAGIELGGQLAAFAAAVSLAWRGLGVWAPVAGIFVWQAVALFGACRAARFSPRLILHATHARKMLAYGFGFSLSMRVWQLRSLVNPLLVGRLAGTEAVAFVALAIRIAEGLGFVRMAAGRLALAALARLQQDRAKFQDALQRALQIQVLTLGPLLCAFALCGPWLVPRFMGERWMPGLQVYPFVAAGVLVNSVFNLQASALFVVGRQWAVVRAYASHVALLAAGTFLLLPRTGLTGYGWAELLACGGYIFMQSNVSKVASLSYRKLLPWVALFLLPLVAQMIGVRFLRVLWLPWLAVLLAAGRQQSRIRFGSGFIGHRRIRHLLTFLMKAQQRGSGYVHDVSKYYFNSAQYRFRLAARRRRQMSLNLPVAESREDTRYSPVFHFAAHEIPQIVSSVPDKLKRSVLLEADRILEQRFCFRRHEETFVERVDWDFCPNGNVSWNWDLNRHAFFLKLATAYYYSNNRQYMRKLLTLWQEWIAANPVGCGRAWQYPFEVAARLRNWSWAYFLAAYSEMADKHCLEQLLDAIHEHGRYLDSHLEYHWPNNHLLLQAKTLSEYTVLFAPLDLELWQRARTVLLREVMTQVLPDGAHSELCSMYHRIIAGELGELTLLCRRQDRRLPEEIERRIGRTMKFSRVAQRDDGSVALLGDSALEDSCLRFDFSRRQFTDLNYWLWRAPAPGPSQNKCLSFRLAALAQGRTCFNTESEASISTPPELHIFPNAGYAFLRSGHGSGQIHLTFDFGPFSRCPSANHGHCDALSFELYANGQCLIVDPGVYLPWHDGAGWNRHFRATGSHNTLKIDGKEQSELSSYADVRRSARTRLLNQWSNHHEAGVTAECIPFWVNGEGIRHIRQIHLHKNNFRIRDCVSGSGKHLLEWSFQFAPEVEVSAQAPGSLVGLGNRQVPLFDMRTVTEVLPSFHLFCGQTDPRRGWVSRNSAEVLPAPVAVYSLLTELPFEIEFAFQLPA